MTDSAQRFFWMRYLRWMAVAMAVVVSAAGTMNIFIDPLGVFDSPRVAGLNAIKPYTDHYRELSRWMSARRVCANAAIFGNSRAEIGFDPLHSQFASQGIQVFNHAIPGSSWQTTYSQLEWLKAAGCAPQTIIMGAEFFDSLTTPVTNLQLQKNVPEPRLDAHFFAEAVFSITGVGDFLNTLLLQDDPRAATLTGLGFNPLNEYITEVDRNGHYALFRQRAEESVQNWTRKLRDRQLVDARISVNAAMLDAIITKAVMEDDTGIYLIIYPYHVEIRIIIERLGLGGMFAQWKKNLVTIAARHANTNSKVEVWDFSGISPETLETIPRRGDHHTHMKYYWEAGHFKKALGDRIISRIFGGKGDFGVKLDNTNIDQWLAKDRASVQDLLATPSPLLAEVDDIFSRHAVKQKGN